MLTVTSEGTSARRGISAQGEDVAMERMTKEEWIRHLKREFAGYEKDAQAQKRLAEIQKSLPDQSAKTMRLAELLRATAEYTRQTLKELEEHC